MGDLRITQIPVEAVIQPNPDARITQMVVEVVTLNNVTAVITQIAVEVVMVNTPEAVGYTRRTASLLGTRIGSRQPT